MISHALPCKSHHHTTIILYLCYVPFFKARPRCGTTPLRRLRTSHGPVHSPSCVLGPVQLSCRWPSLPRSFGLEHTRLADNSRAIPGVRHRSVAALNVNHGRFELAIQALHQHHGPLARIGPKCINVADPSEIKTIHGFARLFPKVWAAPSHLPCTDC